MKRIGSWSTRGWRPSRAASLACLVVLAPVLGAYPSGSAGSHGNARDAGRALRSHFPTQALAILGQVRGSDSFESFASEAGGFVSRSPSRSGVEETTLRLRGGVVSFALPGGAEVHVSESGLTGECALVDEAVACVRPGGASFWTATDHGHEEWLMLAGRHARRDRPVATWAIRGATVRQEGDAILVAAAAAATMLRVTAPRAHAADGRDVGARLRASGDTIELWIDAAGVDVLVDPLWQAVASMAKTRAGHSATALPSGKTLVAGGAGNGGATSELYDPIAGIWALAAPLSQSRYFHTATLLANGKVLVTGGQTVGGVSKQAELYDPAANTWTPTAPMALPRMTHTATRLPDDRVLVTGGTGNINPVADAEVFNPATLSWTPVPVMSTARFSHTATLLNDGKVLVAGGSASQFLSSAELYDPAANAWTATGAMTEPHTQHTATLLDDGSVIVAGGYAGGYLSAATRYDPMTGTWAAAGVMSIERAEHATALLDDGMALVIGGFNGVAATAVDRYDPTAGTWTAQIPMTVGRSQHTLSVLPDGRLLVAGGRAAAQPIGAVEIYSDAAVSCGSAAECVSGFCVDGYCCDSACDAGPCDGCSLAAGGQKDGFCAPLTGAVCDDGDNCTQGDVCQAGVCGVIAVTCSPKDECHDAGMCAPDTGACSDPEKLDGTPCSLGICTAGACGPPPATTGAGTTTGASGSVSAGSGSGSGVSTSSGAGGGGSGGAGVGAAGEGGKEDAKPPPADDAGGCACGIRGGPEAGATWAGLGLLLALRRKKR